MREESCVSLVEDGEDGEGRMLGHAFFFFFTSRAWPRATHNKKNPLQITVLEMSTEHPKEDQFSRAGVLISRF